MNLSQSIRNSWIIAVLRLECSVHIFIAFTLVVGGEKELQLFIHLKRLARLIVFPFFCFVLFQL